MWEFLTAIWGDIKAGGTGFVLFLLLAVLIAAGYSMKKIWDSKIRSEEALEAERVRVANMQSQWVSNSEKMVDRYSKDSAEVAKALSEIEKSLSFINGLLSKI